MADSILSAVPLRRGHFRLESGYHTDLWLTLDALFVSPAAIAPQVAALADLLRPYSETGVGGPVLGGAFLAEALAAHMVLRFYFSQPVAANAEGRLFAAEYALPTALRHHLAGERIAIVDDVISAGSSARATGAALADAGATTVAVGSLLLLGRQAEAHFSALGVPVVALARQEFNLWLPGDCPLCVDKIALEDPAL